VNEPSAVVSELVSAGVSVPAGAGAAEPVGIVAAGGGAAGGIIAAMSCCHAVNDMLQSLLPAVYPNLKAALQLSFGQIGLVTLVYQVTASILQPLIGVYADKRPKPFALPVGTLFTFAGLLAIAFSRGYGALLCGACLLGIGSSVFHPEASRVARMAAARGGRGLSQSIFQVGGNAGSSLGPLAAALVVVRWGQTSLAFFSLLALLSTGLLWRVALWYRRHGLSRLATRTRADRTASVPRGKVRTAVAILVALVFSKYVGVTVQAAQFHLFALLAAVALGTILGGPLGDRFGRKRVIWFSIVATLPFTLALPYASLAWTFPLTMATGAILASAFPAIVVFAQELVPGRVGMISGLFFGLAFGIGGLGAAVLGAFADTIGIDAVYRVCAFLPLIGLLAAFLPNVSARAGGASPG
jgi:FSR family fosmidomycin resistance protein-like MFS transporter